MTKKKRKKKRKKEVVYTHTHYCVSVCFKKVVQKQKNNNKQKCIHRIVNRQFWKKERNIKCYYTK